MTLEEAKELELKITNEILNNTPLSLVVNMVSEQAKIRAKQLMEEATEEQLVEMEKKYKDAEAKAKADIARLHSAIGKKAKVEANKAEAEAKSPREHD